MVERLAPLVGQHAQRAGQLRLNHDETGSNRLVTIEKTSGCIGIFFQLRFPQYACRSIARIRREPLLCQPDGRRQRAGQRQFSVALGNPVERRRLAGNGRRSRAFERSFLLRLSVLVDKEFARRARGSGFSGVDKHIELVGCPVQQQESAAAETRCEGLDNRQRGGNRNRGIESVASGYKDFASGFRRQWMRGRNPALLRRCRTQYARGKQRKDKKKSNGNRSRFHAGIVRESIKMPFLTSLRLKANSRNTKGHDGNTKKHEGIPGSVLQPAVRLGCRNAVQG